MKKVFIIGTQSKIFKKEVIDHNYKMAQVMLERAGYEAINPIKKGFKDDVDLVIELIFKCDCVFIIPRTLRFSDANDLLKIALTSGKTVVSYLNIQPDHEKKQNKKQLAEAS